MDLIAKHLKDDYLRTIKQLNKDDLAIYHEYLSVDDVLKAHYLVCDYFLSKTDSVVLYGVKNINLLCSAVSRQYVSLNGQLKWTNPLDTISTLFYGLVKNHAFHDGNKRTALLTLLLHLVKYKRQIDCRQKDFEELTVRVAAGELKKYTFYTKYCKDNDCDIRTISHFLNKNTHKADKRIHSITYSELNVKLKHYNCYLGNPHGNYIDVYAPRKKFLGITKHIRVLQIGFPGWKDQVNEKALKEVLKATQLTTEHGIDSKAFYEGNEPMYKLIKDYEGPLRRLRDK